MFDLTPGKLTKIILLRKKISDQHICFFICFQDLLKKLRKIGITVTIFPQIEEPLSVMVCISVDLFMQSTQVMRQKFYLQSFRRCEITLGQLI
jgi:hypothetical protein